MSRIEQKVSEGEGTWIDWQYLLDAVGLLRKVSQAQVWVWLGGRCGKVVGIIVWPGNDSDLLKCGHVVSTVEISAWCLAYPMKVW